MPSVYNFNAGPAMLPREVMEQARDEFLDYHATGISVMEMSHRSHEFHEILNSAEMNLRKLLEIPSDYSVVFCPGGATLQFSAVPLNLLEVSSKASYSLTGIWSVKAYQEARKFCPHVEIVYDGESEGFRKIPNLDGFHSVDSRFLYLTSNNTIFGTQYKQFPKTDLPLVADMTSDILSRKIDVRRFGVIFAGAQKNIGPAGLTILIVRSALLGKVKHPIPVLLDWKLLSDNHSLYNTPPTYSIYIAGLVFSWLLRSGGIEAIEQQNRKKATFLYQFLDSSELFYAPVPAEYRSLMNVVFHLRRKELEERFQKESEKEGFIGLPGHRSAGGFRASIYNAMPFEGVEALVSFLREFERKYG